MHNTKQPQQSQQPQNQDALQIIDLIVLPGSLKEQNYMFTENTNTTKRLQNRQLKSLPDASIAIVMITAAVMINRSNLLKIKMCGLQTVQARDQNHRVRDSWWCPKILSMNSEEKDWALSQTRTPGEGGPVVGTRRTHMFQALLRKSFRPYV